MRDWRGTQAVIGDRVFYVTANGTHQPQLHEAWVEDIDGARILVRWAASSIGLMIGTGPDTRWLQQPENFVATAITEAFATRPGS